ncbi:MAG: segregation and condensation protein A [Leptospiraceae bacterium]|nr:MAG: segregation and condensation protein A [Leptospiraceae bacterium]
MNQILNETLLQEDFIVKWKGPDGEMEGPLYVLWQLIESYQVDIFEVSIHRITEDFLNFIQKAKELKIELASSFALMASRLLYYKSKALLPDPGYEDEEQEKLPPEIIQQLLEYKKFQQVAETLREIEELSEGIFTRQNDQTLIEVEETYHINDLIQAYINFIKRKEKQTKHKEDHLEINLENFTIEEKIEYTRQLLNKTTYFAFHELFEDPYHISLFEFIVAFLAILELARLNEIVIEQKEIFGPIYIFKKSVTVR